MARKTNYKFEKLERERRKAEKKAAKAEAKKAASEARDDPSGTDSGEPQFVGQPEEGENGNRDDEN